MHKAIYLFLALLACSAFSAYAAGKHPAATWNYYHFDGNAFIPGPAVDGTAFLAVRESFRPTVLTGKTSQSETVLPDGTGAIAGICYTQSSGGKLGGSGGSQPYPHLPLVISSEGKQLVAVRTDDHGYFVAVLPAGTYSVGSGPVTAEINVERGITTLVPLRIGKRMAD